MAQPTDTDDVIRARFREIYRASNLEKCAWYFDCNDEVINTIPVDPSIPGFIVPVCAHHYLEYQIIRRNQARYQMMVTNSLYGKILLG